MAQGKLKLQANDGKVAGIVFEDGAATDVTVTVPKEGGEFLTTEGAQTKNGVITFADSPIVPTPTTGAQAVNKDYADLKVALTSFIGTNQSFGTSGYQKLPGGFIIQWGQTSQTTQGQTITFPISFPTNCVAVCPVDSVNTTVDLGFSGVDKNVNGFNVYSSPNVIAGFFYIAFGY